MTDWIQAFLDTSFMRFIVGENIHLLMPELILLVAISVGLFQASGRSKQSHDDAWGTALWGSFFAVAVAKVFAFHLHVDPQTLTLNAPESYSVFYGMLRVDLLFSVVRVLVLGGTFMVLLFSRAYLEKNSSTAAEFPMLVLTASLGASFLAGANDLIMLFVALETLGIPSFILAGYFRNDPKSAEAGLKYLLYGGASTAVILFGLSLIYGLSGGYTQFDMITANLQLLDSTLAGNFQPVLMIAMVMLLGGIAFKLSAAPFHQWTPDVYEGAPLPVTAYLSVVSKVAAFALLIRVCANWLYALSPIAAGNSIAVLSGLFVVLSVLSMVIGNIAALRQNNIKRMMAYSTIAHVGYLLLGFVVFQEFALASVLYYLLAYVYMNLGAFAVITLISFQTGRDDIAAYSGLIRKKPFYTLALSIFLLSLAGIPITAGFFAKFFLFQSVIQADSNTLWLIVLALLNSTVSLYYYLNVIRVMVVNEPSDMVQSLTRQVDAPQTLPILLSVVACLAGTLVLGFYAEPAMMYTRGAMAQLSDPAPLAALGANNNFTHQADADTFQHAVSMPAVAVPSR